MKWRNELCCRLNSPVWSPGRFPLTLVPHVAFGGELWMVARTHAYSSPDGLTWTEHDKSDWGDRIYQSVVFFHDEEQRQTAERSKSELEASGRYRKPIVTLIEPAQTFYPAEDYHQQYLEKRGRSSCTTSLARTA